MPLLRSLHPIAALVIGLAALLLQACGQTFNRPALALPPASTAAPLSLPVSPNTAEVETTATAVPSPASLPSQTPEVPTPVPTAAPELLQLTTGGCCSGPFWSPDSSRVLFVDKPSPEAQPGIWGAALAGGPAELFTGRLGLYSNDMQLIAFPEGEETIVERLVDGQRWTIPNGGRSVSFSPDGSMLAWTAGSSGPPFDSARRQVWVSQTDGSQARQVVELTGGGFSGWFPDGRMLVSGRMGPDENGQALWALDPASGTLTELARGERLRSAVLSPEGGWLAYVITFSPDPAQNGLWLINTRTLERFGVSLFGAFRWRDDGRLLLIPMTTEAGSHRLWQVDVASLTIAPLTDPAITPFKVANGDWSVSPDGRWVAFVSAGDANVWLIGLGQ